MISFYTTKQQEEILDGGYNRALAARQKEIDAKEKRTGKLAKYTAAIYVARSPRVFRVIENVAYLGISGKWVPCPSVNAVVPNTESSASASTLYPPIPSTREIGNIYNPDGDFMEKLQGFLQRHKNYEISFSNKMSGTVYYCCDGYPATVTALIGVKPPKIAAISAPTVEGSEGSTSVKPKRRKRKCLFTVKKRTRKNNADGPENAEQPPKTKRVKAEEKESNETLYLIDDDKYDIACG